ncbi:MAG: T9SS type A sorting domain-containing protein [Ignavibacteriaceae bacterium]
MKKIILLLVLFLLAQTGINAEFKTDNKSGGNSSPYKFELEQNYPNPFNPETTIKFTIDKEEYVTLKIFNLIGQEVKTVISEVKSPGVHTIRIDGNNMNSGIYFYTLTSGDLRQTKRMMLVK